MSEIAIASVHFYAVSAGLHCGSCGAPMLVENDDNFFRGKLTGFGHLVHAFVREHYA